MQVTADEGNRCSLKTNREQEEEGAQVTATWMRGAASSRTQKEGQGVTAGEGRGHSFK